MKIELNRNPIHILHITDWHIKSKLSEKGEKEEDKRPKNDQNNHLKIGKETLSKLIQNIKLFLESRGRDSIDILAITGDMMHKNGIKAKGCSYPHEHAVNVINLLQDALNPTFTFCAPGNHDMNKQITEKILNGKFYETVLSNISVPNYEAVDYSLTQAELSKPPVNLKDSFSAYQEFAREINATNQKDPFIGCETLTLKNRAQIFISWFNTAWLSHPNWHKHGDWAKELYKGDYSNISVGYNANRKVFDAFNTFKHNPHGAQFTVSIFHHYPRLLNWWDKQAIKFHHPEEIKKIEENLKEIKSTLKEFHSFSENIDKHGNYRHHLDTSPSFYRHVSQYDLVLNGHTHGSLYDDPYATSPDLILQDEKEDEEEIKSLSKKRKKTEEEISRENKSFNAQFVNILEIDIARNYVTNNPIKIEQPMDKPPKADRIIVFNRDQFLDDLRADYTSEDLYTDLVFNDRMQSPDSEVEPNYIEKLLNIDDLHEKLKDNVENTLSEVHFGEKYLRDNPLIKDALRLEWKAAHNKFMSSNA